MQTPENQPNEILGIVLGFLLLMLCHFLALLLFSLLTAMLSFIPGVNTVVSVIGIIFIAAPMFVQLIYVLPLVLWLRRRGKLGMMKGVIIGATLTALLNGACYLVLFAATRR